MYLRPATENMANLADNDDEEMDKNDLVGVDSAREIDEGDDDMDIQDILRYCSEVATLIGVLSYVVFQQGDEIKNQGFAAFTKQLVTIA